MSEEVITTALVDNSPIQKRQNMAAREFIQRTVSLIEETTGEIISYTCRAPIGYYSGSESTEIQISDKILIKIEKIVSK